MSPIASKKTILRIARYLVLITLDLIFVYPLLFLFSASFKTTAEIFGTARLWPLSFDFSAYVNGWRGTGQIGFSVFMINTCLLVVPVVVFTVISSSLAAYGFSRFHFRFRKVLYATMLALLMLPASVMIIPRYLMFARFGWVNTYLPFTIPALFATNSFFIYLFIQFFRGLPIELDEAAYIEGCGSFRVFVLILLPLCKPVLISAALLQFIWNWNEYLNQLIYINSVSKYTVSLGLTMALDTTIGVEWNQIVAMSVVAILPCFVLFLSMQKYFVEGIITTGLKG